MYFVGESIEGHKGPVDTLARSATTLLNFSFVFFYQRQLAYLVVNGGIGVTVSWHEGDVSQQIILSCEGKKH